MLDGSTLAGDILPAGGFRDVSAGVRRGLVRLASFASCAAALMVCAACGSSCSRDRRAEDVEAELLGYRALAKDSDARLIPEHDAESLPLIRVHRGAGGGFALAFVTTSTSIAAELDAPLVRGEATLLRAHRMRGVARGPGRLELSREGAVVKAWDVRFTEVPDRLPVFAKVRALRAEKRFDEAQAELDRLAPDLSARERLQAIVESARIADAAGRADEAIAKWKQLASTALEAGVPTEASRALRNAAYAYQVSRRILESQPPLDEAEAIDRPIHNFAGQSRTAYYRAIALEELGDFRAAMESRRDAGRIARSLGLDREAGFHEKALAALLQSQGQHERALEVMRAAADYFEGPASPDDRASYENDLGWVLAHGMAQNAFPPDFAQARARFLEALSILRVRNEPVRQANVIANLTWLAMLEGDREQAAKLLEDVRKLDPDDRGYAGPFTRIVAAELALDARRFDQAIAGFERAAAEGLRESGGQGSEYVWRAQYGVARTLAARGDKDAALAHFRTALEEMNRVAERVALRETRTLFFDDRRRLVDDTLELLIERGLDADAFALADASKTNLLRGLEVSVRVERLDPQERAEWNRRIAIHVALRDELEREAQRVSLAVGDQARIAHARLDELRISSARAFDDAYAYLDQTAPLSASPSRSPDRVLSWLTDDEALIASTAVGSRTLSFVLRRAKIERAWGPPSYALGALVGAHHLYVAGDAPSDAELRALLPAMTVSFLPWASLLERPAIEQKGRSLVVADPAGNLPLARREGVAVCAALGDAELLAGEDAGRARVLSALEHAPLFHFAGHGVLDAADPWDSRLELARGEALRLEDLLISRPGVGIVVLNGCDTGRAGLLGKRERIGLPEAFLASGARAVLATVRAVGDKEAQSFIARFYAAKGATSPVEAYRVAATSAAAENDDSWLAFRIFGRR